MNEEPTPGKWYLALWALFPVAVPFYLFGRTPVAAHLGGGPSLTFQPHKVESGVPQIADFLMAFLMASLFLGVGIRFRARLLPVVRAFGWFLAYVLVVNVTWFCMVADPELSLLKSSLFYVYDCCLFLTVLVLHALYKERFFKVTVYAVAVSVLVQVALSPFAYDKTQPRQMLFFNNPNQLGYYAVLAATIFFLASRHLRLGWLLQACFYPLVAYLALLSLSKAAVLAFAALGALTVFKRPVLLLSCVALLVMGLVVVDVVPGLADRLEARLTGQDQDDSLAKRGYDRIVHHWEYLLFGAGEGAYDRFYSEHPGELHSSPGTLLFCYGAIGATLFSVALLRIVRGVEVGDALCLLPPLLYGSAHQGLRFTLLWVLLGWLCCRMRAPGERGSAESEPPAAETAPRPALAGVPPG